LVLPEEHEPQAIRKMVAGANRQFDFLLRERDHTLIRRGKSAGGVERLVDGWWVDVGRPRSFKPGKTWREVTEAKLYQHARRYSIDDLGAPGLGWQRHIAVRFRRTAFWRWAVPPLRGGTHHTALDLGVVNRSARDYAGDLAEASGSDLAEIKEAALLGYQEQRERIGAIEQRANFFLGAAGLTTSLVLANAGLLLGTDRLSSPLLQLAAVALGLASLCAVVAGFRALQATMVTFLRLPPNSVPKLQRRSKLSGDEMDRFYTATLFVAEYREWAVADWKVSRLAATRRWFLGTIVGVMLLTAFVLVETLAA
jgi:hypothetical protein